MAEPAISTERQDGAVRRATRKATIRLMPLLVLMYFFNQLDRVNVGFAALTMNADIGLSTTAYGLGAGLFFIGYFVFEIPSNMILRRVGARVWIARIMISWGVVASATAFVQGELSFNILRVLLGVAEAGFIPGMIFYLSQWFPSGRRTKILSLFFLAPILASMIGGPVSTALVQYGDGLLAFVPEGWRLMFFVEGIPAVLLGFVVLYVMHNRPSQARWLSADEASALEEAMALEDSSRVGHHAPLRTSLRDPVTLLVTGIYFGVVVSFYVLNLFLPQVIKDFENVFGTKYTLVQVGLINAIPYAVAIVGTLLWARLVARRGMGRWSVAVPCLVEAVMVGLALYMKSPFLVIVLVSVAAACIFSLLPVIWEIPSRLLGGAAAAAGLAFIGSVSNLGGFIGPYLIGWLKDLSGSFRPGMWVVAGLLVISGLLTIWLPRLERGDREVGHPTTERLDDPDGMR